MINKWQQFLWLLFTVHVWTRGWSFSPLSETDPETDIMTRWNNCLTVWVDVFGTLKQTNDRNIPVNTNPPSDYVESVVLYGIVWRTRARNALETNELRFSVAVTLFSFFFFKRIRSSRDFAKRHSSPSFPVIISKIKISFFSISRAIISRCWAAPSGTPLSF